jgi:hypothetical protein
VAQVVFLFPGKLSTGLDSLQDRHSYAYSHGPASMLLSVLGESSLLASSTLASPYIIFQEQFFFFFFFFFFL